MFENVVVFGSFLIRTSVVEESLRHVDEDGGEEEEQHEDNIRERRRIERRHLAFLISTNLCHINYRNF